MRSDPAGDISNGIVTSRTITKPSVLEEGDIAAPSRGSLAPRLQDDDNQTRLASRESRLDSPKPHESEEPADRKKRHAIARDGSIRIRRHIKGSFAAVATTIGLVFAMMFSLSQAVVTESISTMPTGDTQSQGLTRQKSVDELPRVDVDQEGLSKMFESGEASSATEAEKWADALIYIQWGARQEDCWPIQIKTPAEVECGSTAVIMAAILLTGDYTITPNSMLEATEAKYGIHISNDGHSYFLKYMEEEWGIHHKSLGHLTAEEAKALLEEGHIVEIGVGCEQGEGLPYCKAEGVKPRCCHGHTIIFYKYENGIFYAKDTAPGDGAAMCLYPEGPLTVTHQGAMGGRDIHNGETVSFDNYADAFFRVGWCSDIWSDNPAKGITARPPGVTLPKKDEKSE